MEKQALRNTRNVVTTPYQPSGKTSDVCARNSVEIPLCSDFFDRKCGRLQFDGTKLRRSKRINMLDTQPLFEIT